MKPKGHFEINWPLDKDTEALALWKNYFAKSPDPPNIDGICTCSISYCFFSKVARLTFSIQEKSCMKQVKMVVCYISVFTMKNLTLRRSLFYRKSISVLHSSVNPQSKYKNNLVPYQSYGVMDHKVTNLGQKLKFICRYIPQNKKRWK